jgi:hypothetical protein
VRKKIGKKIQKKMKIREKKKENTRKYEQVKYEKIQASVVKTKGTN